MRFPAIWFCFFCACQAAPATQFEIVRPLSLAQCIPEFEVFPARNVLSVGRLETITFETRASLVCNGVQTMPEGFFVEAVDDQNAPVALEVRVDASRPPRFQLHVTLQSPESSSVLFRVRVEPSIGQHQQSVQVIRPEARAWMPVANALGTLGVIEGPGGRELFLERGSVRIRLRSGDVWTRSAQAVAVTPNRVWIVGARIEAWRFDATEEAVLAASWPLALNPTAIASRGTKVFMAGLLPSGSSLMQFDEAGPSVGPIRLVPSLVIGAARFISDDELQVSRGELLDVVRPASLDASVELSGPSVVRSYSLSASADGLWLSDGMDLSVTRPDGGVSRVPLTGMSPQTGLPPIRLAEAVPISTLNQTTLGDIVAGVPIDAPDGGLEWRYVQPPADSVPLWSNGRWLFARGVDGGLFRAPRVP